MPTSSTFSGDKLLGSVQSGFIVGRRAFIERVNRNPLKRALRCDKITLAILHYTLRLYQQPDRLARELPLIATLMRSPGELRPRADAIAGAFGARLSRAYRIRTSESRCQIGSGALPEATLPSLAVVIEADTDTALRALASALRALAVPVLGRLHDGALWLDVRSVDDVDGLCANLADLTA